MTQESTSLEDYQKYMVEGRKKLFQEYRLQLANIKISACSLEEKHRLRYESSKEYCRKEAELELNAPRVTYPAKDNLLEVEV